ncbi:MAG: DUF4296 domain-containing protein [Candidatus Zixiibacteriota bacterium]
MGKLLIYFLLDNLADKEVFKGKGFNGKVSGIKFLSFLTLIKNKLIIIIFSLFFLIILFIIFNSQKTSSRLSEEKFVEVYVQLSFASKMYETNPAKLGQERKKVLEQHAVTQEEIDRFIKEYNINPEKWAKVWERIVRRLEQEKEKTTPPP